MLFINLETFTEVQGYLFCGYNIAQSSIDKTKNGFSEYNVPCLNRQIGYLGPYHLDPFDVNEVGYCGEYEGKHYDKLEFMCKEPLETEQRVVFVFRWMAAFAFFCCLGACAICLAGKLKRRTNQRTIIMARARQERGNYSYDNDL
jgi:hypothetical protein